jgi:hypothetical protein
MRPSEDLSEDVMTRMLRIGIASAVLLSVACVPEMQPAVPDCTSQSVPYDSAPESFKTAELEDAIVQYEALAGQWAADIVCPPDRPPARTLVLSIATRPRSEIQFATGCGVDGEASTHCQVSLTGEDFPELNGQSTQFDVSFWSRWNYKVLATQLLDPSYDPSFDFISLAVGVETTNVVSGWLTYAFQPRRNGDGSMTEEFYDCPWTNARRVGP